MVSKSKAVKVKFTLMHFTPASRTRADFPSIPCSKDGTWCLQAGTSDWFCGQYLDAVRVTQLQPEEREDEEKGVLVDEEGMGGVGAENRRAHVFRGKWELRREGGGIGCEE